MVVFWYNGTPFKAGKPYTRQRGTGLSRRLVEDFIRQFQVSMDEWIVANGLRCSGSIRDQSSNPFAYDSSLPYPDDGSLLNVEDDSRDEDFDDANEGEEEEELIYFQTKVKLYSQKIIQLTFFNEAKFLKT